MNERTNRTVICSIAFLDIVDYSKRVGQEQLAMKERFNTLIAEVVKDIAQNDRVLIDTGDGAALCFMGAPEDALFVSMNLRDLLRTPECEAMGLSVRFGINLGPVRMIHDINGHQNVIGDGINVAQRVMSFADPNQIMVSRSYYEVVSRLSREYTLLFHYAGARTDKHVREHEVFEVGAPGGRDDPAQAAIVPPPPADTVAGAPLAQAESIGVTPAPQAADIGSAAAPVAAGAASPPPPPPIAAAPAEAAATVPAPKRNKWLIPGAVAAVILLALAMYAGTLFKSGKVSEPARVETPAPPAADATAPKVAAGSAPETKADEAKVPPPVAGSDSATKPGADIKVSPPVAGPIPGAKSATETKTSQSVAGSLPGTKSGAEAKMSAVPGAKPGADAKMSTAAGAKSDADAKAAAAKDKALAAGSSQEKALSAAEAQKKEAAGAKKNEARKDDVAKADKSATGTLEFWINPWGDVFIDGKQVGTAPPLKVYKLPPGPHKVEIYNDSAGFPFKTTVEVKADQVSRINQTWR